MIVPAAALSGRRKRPVTVATDVAIVGAGLAGLFLAFQLRRRGLRVAVLETGSVDPAGRDQPSPVYMTGRNHLGATQGRSIGLGGTSALWSGGLIPLQAADSAARPHVSLPAWPVDMNKLSKYAAEVETFFSVDHESYECEQIRKSNLKTPPDCHHPDFALRHAKIVPFKSRNVAQVLSQAIKNDTDLRIYANANVTGIRLDQSGERVESLTAAGPADTFEIRASHFVLAAGAIETTRLLLALKERGGSRVLDSCTALGRYFFDHLSMTAATFKPKDIAAFSEFGAYHFVGSAMRSMRFELSPSAQASDGVLSVYGYIHYEGGGEFERLRRMLHSTQRSASISPALALDALKSAPYLAKILFWRFYHQRLLWTENGRLSLKLIGEQMPRSDSRLTLTRETDRFGQPQLAMNWLASGIDFDTLKAFCRRFDRYWRTQSLDRFAALQWVDQLDGAIEKAADFYHPAGTTRMGDDRVNSVVRPDLRLHAISNMYVASTSVFPSGASSNPTLTQLLLTQTIAETLARTTHSPELRALA